MTKTTEHAQSPTSLYEQQRDSLDGEAGISWRDGDRWTSYLREKFETIKADEKLSEEGRYEAAEQYLAKTRPRIEQAYEAARSHLEAEAADDHQTVLSAIDQASNQLKLLAQLLGKLHEIKVQNNLQVNVIALEDHPEWQRVEDVLTRALEPYPAARYAVADALKELGP